MSGIISNPEDSLFIYGEGENATTFFKPDFVPVFEPSFSDPILEQEANSICGDDIFCRYDIAVTGRTDIGAATLQGNIELERIVNNTLPGIKLMYNYILF